jgi:DNA polymerase-3 subunit alpha (Gram-positive type)
MKLIGVNVKGGLTCLLLLLSGCRTHPSPAHDHLPELVVFDVETTGFSSTRDRIVEIGAVAICDGRICHTSTWLIDPGMPIPARATAVHGITDVDIAGMPDFKSVYAEFSAFTAGAPLVAHNASFDIRFIKAECMRNGLESPDNDVYDSLSVFRALYPSLENHRLSTLARVHTLSVSPNHRGEQDARVLAELLIANELTKADCFISVQKP